jgi:hypothetical protein
MWPRLSSIFYRLSNLRQSSPFSYVKRPRRPAICAGGFMIRGALWPRTTFYPCR